MGRSEDLNRMTVVCVDSAAPKQREEVETALVRRCQCVAQAAHLPKRTIGDRRVDAWQILWNTLSGTDV